MTIFREIIGGGFEQIAFCHDAESGLRAIVAIHNTAAGPSLGGCRYMTYGDEEDALQDALRLARGMTYKNAAYKLPYGGGKAVVWRDPAARLEESGPEASWAQRRAGSTGTAELPGEEYGRRRLFESLGRFIEGLGGRYITGLDLGTCIQDMDAIQTQTSYVTDTSGSIMAQDDFTAEMTAYGVYQGMKAAVGCRLGLPSLYDLKVLVQGLGKVGFRLCRYLYEDGARLIVSDPNDAAELDAVRYYGARRVKPENVYRTKCDVFAPCALGGILNDVTIPRLRCSIVAGAANNQLSMERHGELIEERGILYVPDYILNAGGIIITAGELQGLGRAELQESVKAVAETAREVFHLAEKYGIPPSMAAKRLAEQNLERLKER
ncbi:MULTISPECIES: amino acid dehydrogenase [unclassified Paenibacillus]|uniref:Leu/Phe/Val dehydrogenase n=1 Tax=unclassified Paenibacillus TaxID=185978 RepID=UPI0009554AB8|nr:MULTISPECIES: amino acid dehydrogenase [unclassified Paenibacillus]ASS67399.1 amino acid dehydrogenase [Paenibacillus sp. RUD330]SIQ78478.1 leucine dehydrogenase [Paenibacillus sp. RU4X]SIQ99918.1 leucine dehydrogenase [Paenibacillus sp. RU4T]